MAGNDELLRPLYRNAAPVTFLRAISVPCFFWTRSKEAPLALSKLLCESSDLLGSFETLFLVVLVRAVDVVEHEHIYTYTSRPWKLFQRCLSLRFSLNECVSGEDVPLKLYWSARDVILVVERRRVPKHLPISLTRLRLARRCEVARTTRRQRTNICPQCSNWFCSKDCRPP